MRRTLLAALIAATAPAASAAGDPACHTPAEIEAAEAIRFHTDLLVGGLACRDRLQGRDTYDEFRRFTTKHERTLVAYEQVLIDRFGRLYPDDPLARFHTYRTELANELSDQLTHTPMRPFCAGQAALLTTWETMDSATLRDYAKRRRHMEAHRYRTCPDL